MSERASSGGLALAQRVIGFAEQEGATEAEALVLGGSEQLTRFANSQIHQNVAETNRLVNLRFCIGKQVGVASTNRLDDESLRKLAQSAAQIARLQPEREDFAGLPQPTPVTPVSGAYVAATANASPEERAEAARAVIAAADEADVLSFGSFKTSTEEVAVANSHGIAVEEERTFGHLITVSMGPDGEAGYAEGAAVDHRQIDAAALGREAAAKARASRNPQELPPGDYPVVLEEYAVSDLLDMLGFLGFSALAVQEQRSFYEPGRVIGSELVTVVDDAADPGGAPASFDYEGVAKQRVSLIERGVCVDVVYDAQTAAK
ncbi:MAG TPA: metallopeptidase TldD-related protein, partial [Candidatus Limnocylindrales bacterium]